MSLIAKIQKAPAGYIAGERAHAKGYKLFTVTYLPDASTTTAPTAILCFHHGIGEHIGRYKEIFSRFADAGIAVYSGDVAGHGKSEGHRAYVDSYVETVDEFEAFCKHAAADVRSRFPAAAASPPPMFIAGHSMGGLIAALTCLRDQSAWTGLMVCSPALDVEWNLVLRMQAVVGDLLAALVPKARLVPAVDPAAMNPDPELVKDIMADPLNTVGNLPIRTGNEVLRGMRLLRKHWPEFTLPIYAHHGAVDKCTSAPATQAFVAAAGSADKTLHLVPGGFHEVLMSPGVGEGLTDGMIGWIKQHSGAAGGAAKM
jgi:acylglycerol lipase